MSKHLLNLLKNCSLFKGKVNGFTLVEVLLVIGIIGIVAVLTIPPLVQNYEEMSWQTSASVFHRRLAEAFKIMHIERKLTGLNSTEQFVQELSKKMKISKVCSASNLSDCFPDKIKRSSGKEIDIANFKTSADFGKPDYNSELVGVVFANGIHAIIAYNKSYYAASGTEIAKLTSVSDKIVNLNTDVISMLYDVSGFSTPNSLNQDVFSLNTNLASSGQCEHLKIGDYCVADLGYPQPIKCITGTGTDIRYCEKIHGGYYNDKDYWAGAKKTCEEAGMRLISKDEAVEICNVNNNNAIIPIGSSGEEYFTSTPKAYGNHPYYIKLGSCATYGVDEHVKHRAFCVSK